VTRQPTRVEVEGGFLAADEWPADAPTVVLLHAGVCDRRSWWDVADRLDGDARLVAYDRRGYGDTPTDAGHADLDDLRALLDEVTDEPVWLVGSSKGGELALDAALAWPERLAGLVLLAPAVSGAPKVEDDDLDPATRHVDGLAMAALDSGDVEEINRFDAWMWLDGPAGPEHRVTGPARELMLAMNATIISNQGDENSGGDGRHAWDDLEKVDLPTWVCWGDLDVPVLLDRCRTVAARIPLARQVVWQGLAHLPYLESPQVVADVIRDAVTD
jgi:pimeloyl-ACP methyl ester carboxylesterase